MQLVIDSKKKPKLKNLSSGFFFKFRPRDCRVKEEIEPTLQYGCQSGYRLGLRGR